GAATAGRVPGTVATERAGEAPRVAGRHHSRDARRAVIVLDASVVVELLLGTQAVGPLAARIRDDAPWHAPAVLDLEVANAIRRLCAIRQTSHERGSRAIGDLGVLPVRRSEERRVGKECRSRCVPCHYKKKELESRYVGSRVG